MQPKLISDPGRVLTTQKWLWPEVPSVEELYKWSVREADYKLSVASIATMWAYWVFDDGTMFSFNGQTADDGPGMRAHLFASWRAICEIAPVKRFMILSEVWRRAAGAGTPAVDWGTLEGSHSAFMINIQTRWATCAWVHEIVEEVPRRLEKGRKIGVNGPMSKILHGSTPRDSTPTEQAIINSIVKQ